MAQITPRAFSSRRYAPPTAAPIASATSPEQLAELAAAAGVDLSAAEMAELDAASA